MGRFASFCTYIGNWYVKLKAYTKKIGLCIMVMNGCGRTNTDKKQNEENWQKMSLLISSMGLCMMIYICRMDNEISIDFQ